MAKSADTMEVMNNETGEVLEVSQSTELAKRPDIGGVMIGGQSFKVVGLVNVPTLKHETNATVAFTALQRIVEGINEVTEEVVVNGVKVMATKEVPINVVRVLNLYDGQQYEYVLNAIAADSLINGYPDHSYVGKSFAIRKGNVVPGKRYKEVEVLEIEPAT